jgi:uncharacterized membrane protein
MRPRRFVRALDEERIVAAIREAEGRSRGELHVHVTDRWVEDVRGAAVAIFEKLGMSETAERNGVLLFVAPATQRLAVIGDRGIHERCGEGLWSEVASEVSVDFREHRYTEGILRAIARVGAVLARHYPRLAGVADKNELPDAVSRD